jgi:hypothetical protein
MMRQFLEWLTTKMNNPRVIYDMMGESPYLSRYYILGRPRMADGSDPFDRFGNPHPETIWPTSSLGLYLHRFHRGDSDRELHNHPWRWALSLILVGGYNEERRIGNAVVKREVKPGSLNFIGADDFHRVDMRDGDAWSLFFVGPKSSSWGFWNRNSGVVTPWREFINSKRDSTSFARETVS